MLKEVYVIKLKSFILDKDEVYGLNSKAICSEIHVYGDNDDCIKFIVSLIDGWKEWLECSSV